MNNYDIAAMAHSNTWDFLDMAQLKNNLTVTALRHV